MNGAGNVSIYIYISIYINIKLIPFFKIETWQNRGIIPRTLSYIFDEIERRSSETEYNIYISFMEIYNENAYDLLDHTHLETPLESWNKVKKNNN